MLACFGLPVCFYRLFTLIDRQKDGKDFLFCIGKVNCINLVISVYTDIIIVLKKPPDESIYLVPLYLCNLLGYTVNTKRNNIKSFVL